MGVVHFIPLGTNPGAVTSALAYLKHKYPNGQDVKLGRVVEAILLFAPREIKNGNQKKYRAEACIFNDYGKCGSRKSYKDENVFEIALDFIQAEIAPIMTKPTIYWCEAFADNYEKSFRSVAEAVVLELSKPEAKGKNLWVNLTGGTNVMNAALMQMSFLSGLVSNLYYTFVPESEKRYLQPASDNFNFIEVPLIKTSIDEAHCMLLKALGELNGEWVDSDDLLGFLRPIRSEEFPDLPPYFEKVSKEALEKEFLMKLAGRGLERETLADGRMTFRTRLTEDGKKLLAQLDDEIFRALTKRGWTERGKLDELQHSYGWEDLSL
jgi:hypothetical protein